MKARASNRWTNSFKSISSVSVAARYGWRAGSHTRATLVRIPAREMMGVRLFLHKPLAWSNLPKALAYRISEARNIKKPCIFAIKPQKCQKIWCWNENCHELRVYLGQQNGVPRQGFSDFCRPTHQRANALTRPVSSFLSRPFSLADTMLSPQLKTPPRAFGGLNPMHRVLV